MGRLRKRYYTIGMAGHIDHGKTALTKALTNIDTDRLKEEKERHISIELGFAPLHEEEDLQISIVDVPGHERFVKKMIAGTGGIDMVVLVVAADEGIMPQTREHLDILSLLGISNGIVVLTKMSKVDLELRELAKDEVKAELEGSPFENAPLMLVDSITGEGIQELKDLILKSIEDIPVRRTEGDFRLPVDQIFSLKGQGTIVRGTIYEGEIETGAEVTILPQGIQAKARQIQVHGQKRSKGSAGQRAAINLAGVNYLQIERGDAVVSSSLFTVTDTIDVSLKILGGIKHGLKQRMEVKFHTGTTEVMGKLVFFDRNKTEAAEDSILCQIRLNRKIVVKRGDRFILRRATPAETLGGGWIINPSGGKYRFGSETISMLRAIMEGSAEERMMKLLQQKKSVPSQSLILEASLGQDELQEIMQKAGWILLRGSFVTHINIVESCEKKIIEVLVSYHETHPMEKGINKGELQPLLEPFTDIVIHFSIERLIQQKEVSLENGLLHMHDFIPSLPSQWEKRCYQLLHSLREDKLKVRTMEEYFKEAGIPDTVRQEFHYFFVGQNWIVPLDDKHAYAWETYNMAVNELKEKTDRRFNITEAKEILGLSRKYMIPFLERLDKDGYTIRINDERKWIS
ncbi:selenocysteine-specific translation elongation factor [Lysinibacillus sphaericus]